MHVEDHPLEYGEFEGIIPKGQYGGGTVLLWDRGTWEPVGDPHKAYRAGKLKFTLHGEKLQGGWALVQDRRASKGRRRPELAADQGARRRSAAGPGRCRSSRVSRRASRPAARSRRSPPPETASGTPIATAARARARDPAERAGRAPGRLPKFVEPQLATLRRAPAGR